MAEGETEEELERGLKLSVMAGLDGCLGHHDDTNRTIAHSWL
jgi:hypothetical protein